MTSRPPVLAGLRVLTIEDDPAISRLLQLELEHRGMEVLRAADGLTGLDAVRTFRPDVILLDILLPAMDGERILSMLRRDGVHTPVIMLTARDRASDKIRNLDVGADDYLTKPFDIDELLARMRAVLRRSAVGAAHRVQVADLELDRDARLVTRGGEAIDLTAREYELLDLLMTNARQVLPRETILERIWGFDAEVDPNILDVYIGYLRRKIDRPETARLIHTVRGVGFTLREDR
ncbi:MAG: response regulator transcription factor [Thermomicrobiales bacterium]